MTSHISRWPTVRDITGLSRSTIRRLESEGSFPQRVQLGRNSVGWYLTEIEAWCASRRSAPTALDKPEWTRAPRNRETIPETGKEIRVHRPSEPGLDVDHEVRK